MAVPKRKQSKARSRSRCTHKVEHVMSITHCTNCATPLRTHQVCGACGFYKGAKVMRTKSDRAIKRGQKLQAAQARTQQAGAEQVAN